MIIVLYYRQKVIDSGKFCYGLLESFLQMVGMSREVCVGMWYVCCFWWQMSKLFVSYGDNIKFCIIFEMIIGFNCGRKIVNGYYLR